MKIEIQKLYVGFLKYDGSVSSYEMSYDDRNLDTWVILDINDYGASTLKISLSLELWENTRPGAKCGYRPEYMVENLQAWSNW